MKIIKIFIIMSTLLLSINGMGQTSAMPIINKIINSYLDTLLINRKLDSKDTLLLSKQYKIDDRFFKIPNFKRYTDSLIGKYYILRYTLEELSDNCIKIKVHLNTIKKAYGG